MRKFYLALLSTFVMSVVAAVVLGPFGENSPQVAKAAPQPRKVGDASTSPETATIAEGLVTLHVAFRSKMEKRKKKSLFIISKKKILY